MNIKLLNDLAKVPTRGSRHSAGYDLYCASENDIVVPPQQCVKIPTGIAVECSLGYFGAVFPRSGLATKQGLRLANCVAVIDEDYRGEWFVPLYNDTHEPQVVHCGDRIAQVVFLPYLTTDFNVVNELTETNRGAGGFGSTGVN